MCEDLVGLVECSATLLTFRWISQSQRRHVGLSLINDCFSRCNATTWTTRTTTWMTIKLSKSSLQLKLFHHNLHLVGST